MRLDPDKILDDVEQAGGKAESVYLFRTNTV